MSNNIQQWNPGAANQENDASYTADSLRSGGAGTDAIFPSITANKLFYQVSTVCAALGSALSAKGYVISDASLSTLTGVLEALVTLADFTVTSNANGHAIKLPNGWVIQFGTLGSLNNNTPTTGTFPIAFPTAGFALIANDNSSFASGGNPRTMGCLFSGTTQFTILANGSGSSAFWIAIGN